MTTTPPWIRSFLLLLLPLIAIAIYWDGQTYDPALLDFKKPAPGLTLPTTLLDLPRTGPSRVFTRENLYEYINGHAESYIASGFKRLIVADYGSDMTLDLYDMGKPLHAFGMLMEEAGEGTTPIKAGHMGFSHQRGMLFILGPYFIKVQTFRTGLPLAKIGETLSKHLGIDPDKGGLDFAFPQIGKPLATRFVKQNYRGMGFLGNVLERSVEVAGVKAELAMIRDPGVAAVEKELVAFLDREGIPYTREETPRGRLWRVEDPYEGGWRLLVARDGLMGFFGPGAEAALKAWGEHAKTTQP